MTVLASVAFSPEKAGVEEDKEGFLCAYGERERSGRQSGLDTELHPGLKLDTYHGTTSSSRTFCLRTTECSLA